MLHVSGIVMSDKDGIVVDVVENGHGAPSIRPLVRRGLARVGLIDVEAVVVQALVGVPRRRSPEGVEAEAAVAVEGVALPDPEGEVGRAHAAVGGAASAACYCVGVHKM